MGAGKAVRIMFYAMRQKEKSMRETGLKRESLSEVFEAAKTFGGICKWSVSNLKMQKILYLSHMVCLGRYQTPLVGTPFEAWDFGPVQPSLYHKLKRFGAGNVRDVFYGEEMLTEGRGYEVLQDMYPLCSFSPGELVGLTHRDGGAWSKVYKPGAKGIVIDNSLVSEEYTKLFLESSKSSAS